VLVKEKYTADFSVTDTWGNMVNTDAWTTTLHSSQPILVAGNTQPIQDVTFPLSSQFQFQPLKENTITFDITAKHSQDNIQQSLTITALEDIRVEATMKTNGAIKVGQKLPITFTIKTKDGSIIPNWNMPLHIGTKGTMAHLEDDLVTFTN